LNTAYTALSKAFTVIDYIAHNRKMTRDYESEVLTRERPQQRVSSEKETHNRERPPRERETTERGSQERETPKRQRQPTKQDPQEMDPQE